MGDWSIFIGKVKALVIEESSKVGRRLMCTPLTSCLDEPMNVTLKYEFDLPPGFGDPAKVTRWASTEAAVNTINTKILKVYKLLRIGKVAKIEATANGNSISADVTMNLPNGAMKSLGILNSGYDNALEKNMKELTKAAKAAKDTLSKAISVVMVPSSSGPGLNFEEIFNALLLLVPLADRRLADGSRPPSLEEIVGEVLSVPVTPRPRRLSQADEVSMQAIVAGGDQEEIFKAVKAVTPDDISEGIKTAMTDLGLDPAKYADMKPKSLSAPKKMTGLAVVSTTGINTGINTTEGDGALRHGWSGLFLLLFGLLLLVDL